ncbi:MAG: tetratricopeptide repeat protein [Trueperaceae bacterium]|nr:tetratricopeptide repeat protein [Trueperaceae bacterium]
MDSYYDLGNYSWKVSTASPEAQIWFDRGLIWCYAYNHEESVRCFQKAAELDPNFAMAYWGIAYAAGCNYNRTWQDFTQGELTTVLSLCRDACEKANARLEHTTPIERSLIEALESRYQSAQIVSDEEFCVWNDDYARAMRQVYQQFPNHSDVVTLFAEALINRTPWQLWNLVSGKPAEGADTLEAVEVLERALGEREGKETHPGLAHMYIHVMEMSPHPEKALRASDSLRELVPDAGHLLHMPSHIDVLCGDYYNAVWANERAIIADNKYLANEGPLNFYTSYRCHDFHFKIYAAMFLGNYQAAHSAVQEMINGISDKLLRTDNMADFLEGIISMHLHVYIRFGKWQEILAETFPEDREFYSVTTTMLHYARAVAYAASGRVAEAEKEQTLFYETYPKIPESRRIFNNTCLDIMAVAQEMMNGEIEYRKANYDAAFDHLRQSVQLDDNLLYAEPWGWMQPTRHALGALLLEQGHIEEAASVYRADLGLDSSLSRPSQHPDNVWSLHGYVECLRKLGKTAEADALQARLDRAVARADVPIHASCFCRLEHQQDCCH